MARAPTPRKHPAWTAAESVELGKNILAAFGLLVLVSAILRGAKKVLA
jgi:hypothetical protein